MLVHISQHHIDKILINNIQNAKTKHKAEDKQKAVFHIMNKKRKYAVSPQKILKALRTAWS